MALFRLVWTDPLISGHVRCQIASVKKQPADPGTLALSAEQFL